MCIKAEQTELAHPKFPRAGLQHWWVWKATQGDLCGSPWPKTGPVCCCCVGRLRGWADTEEGHKEHRHRPEKEPFEQKSSVIGLSL